MMVTLELYIVTYFKLIPVHRLIQISYKGIREYQKARKRFHWQSCDQRS